jgi:hypothetical protein
MRTANLAREPFANTRPLVVVSIALSVAALVATTLNLVELGFARHAERELSARLVPLERQRAELLEQVSARDRELSTVPWKKLRTEAGSLDKALVTRSLVWTRLLSDLERVVPWDVRLVTITPSIDGAKRITLGLTGIATGRKAWLDLVARLFTDHNFSEPMPASEEAPGATNALGYRFQLRVRYWPEGRS